LFAYQPQHHKINHARGAAKVDFLRN